MATSATNTDAMATSATNTEKWETEKWETGINATATNIKEVKAFVDWRLSIYKENGWKGFDLWESFVNDFKSFTRDILNNLGKDQLKKIRDYLRENRVYVRKEASKSIADSLLGVIHEPTPSKWPVDDSIDDDPTDDHTDDPTDDHTDDPTDGPTNGPTDDPTDDPTPALPSLSTAPVQIIQPTPATTPPTSAQITQATDQLALQGSFGREITNLTKLYTDEVKYSSKQDNFDFKFKIFQNYCLRAGVPKQAYTFITEFGPFTGSIKGKEDQGASNFYLDIEPYSSYYNDPKAEAFWTEFAKGEG